MGCTLEVYAKNVACYFGPEGGIFLPTLTALAEVGGGKILARVFLLGPILEARVEKSLAGCIPRVELFMGGVYPT